MQLTDFSPPLSPSVEEQRDALAKGLGRAVGWSARGVLEDGPLLDACLRDKRFDRQIDERRSNWLWKIIASSGAERRILDSILEGFQQTATEDLDQLCGLAVHYARQGASSFTRRLHEIVAEKPVPFCAWIGEQDLLELCGEQGFLFIARARGASLSDRTWDCEDAEIVDSAMERFGNEQVEALLQNSADAAIRRFERAWKESQAPRESTQRMAEQERGTLLIDSIVQSARSARYGVAFRGIGMRATEAELEQVLDALWTAHEPNVIANLLMVFSNRQLPRFDPRLFSFCRHGEEKVRSAAFRAIARNSHPLVREFAIEQLHRPTMDVRVIRLFVHNYHPGDEQLLLAKAELPTDENQLHWCLMDALDLLEKNPESDSSQLGLIVYAKTPCAMCRSRAVKRLVEQRVAPDWLLSECRDDCDKETRALVKSE